MRERLESMVAELEPAGPPFEIVQVKQQLAGSEQQSIERTAAIEAVIRVGRVCERVNIA